MSYALARGTRWEPAPRDHEEWQRDRDQVVADFWATYDRRPIGPQVDGITAHRRWLRGAIAVEKRNGQTGRAIHRSWSQMFRGVANDLDWELAPTARENLDRYRNQVANRLNYLIDMGDLESWEPVYNHKQESTGILLRVPAGVAQSVQPSLRFRRSRRAGSVTASARQIARRDRAEHRNSPSGEFSTPFGPRCGGVSPSSLTETLRDERAPSREAAPARASVDAIERACTPRLRPALRRLRTALRGEERPRGVLKEACRAGVSPVVVALACWDLATQGREPKLSLAQRAQLERSAAQYDRLNGPGTAALWFAQELDNFAVHDWESEVCARKPIRSLAYYVHTFKQVARSRRRAARGVGKPRAWKSRKPEASSW